MNLNLVQSIGVTALFLILSYLLYNRTASTPHPLALKRITKVFIFFSGVLLFFNINLYSSTKEEIRTMRIVQKYTIPATMDLIAAVHDPKNTVHMDENRIYINKGTDQEKVYVFLWEPVFGILDQSKTVAMGNELSGSDAPDDPQDQNENEAD